MPEPAERIAGEGNNEDPLSKPAHVVALANWKVPMSEWVHGVWMEVRDEPRRFPSFCFDEEKVKAQMHQVPIRNGGARQSQRGAEVAHPKCPMLGQ